jgi:hypothetical protein
MIQSNSIFCIPRITRRAHFLAMGALLLCVCSSARAIDFATVAAAFGAPNVGWQLVDGNGDILMPFDANNSGPGRYVFDNGTQPWGAPLLPAAVLTDNGDGTVNVTITDAFGNAHTLNDAADMETITSWMDPLGFLCEATSSGAGSSGGTGGAVTVTSGTVSLAAGDSANLQGVFQVGLWIFGAILMLPIVLKVRPT